MLGRHHHLLPRLYLLHAFVSVSPRYRSQVLTTCLLLLPLSSLLHLFNQPGVYLLQLHAPPLGAGRGRRGRGPGPVLAGPSAPGRRGRGGALGLGAALGGVAGGVGVGALGGAGQHAVVLADVLQAGVVINEF